MFPLIFICFFTPYEKLSASPMVGWAGRCIPAASLQRRTEEFKQ